MRITWFEKVKGNEVRRTGTYLDTVIIDGKPFAVVGTDESRLALVDFEIIGPK